MKVLLVAYACKPFFGTEYAVGWNLFRYLSKLADVHLITEAGPKEQIILECKKLEIDTNKISFIDIEESGRKACDAQGTWSFYYKYRNWQLQALAVAQKLHGETPFDVVHQLNMIGYREPGFMNVLGIPFIIGPVGGFGGVKLSYLSNLSKKSASIQLIKNFLNFLNMFFPRIRKTFKSADRVFSAVPEAKQGLSKSFKVSSTILPETGCGKFQGGSDFRKNFIWIGKNVDRKMFSIAALSFLNSKWCAQEKLIVLGEFTKKERDEWLHSNIQFLGNLPHSEVYKYLSKSRALIFPSVHEGNPHVIYEAISCATPVICHDCYGMGFTVSNDLGMKVPLNNYAESLEGFTRAINSFHDQSKNEYETANFRRFALENSWKQRAVQIFQTYKLIVKK